MEDFRYRQMITWKDMARCGMGLVVLVAGCAPQSGSIDLPEMPAEFSGTGLQAVPDRWWRSFGDGDLSRMEEQALISNFSLEAAWQRLRQAEAVTDRERSGLFPDLDALLDGQATSDGGQGVSAGAGVSYEVDLWGKIRSRIAAEKMRSQASLADYRAAALTVSAEVARTWYQLVESRAQLDLIDDQIEANEKVRKQLRVRVVEGQGRAVDLLRQEQLVAATREQRTVVEADVGVLENRLAVLQGRAPQGGISAGRRVLPTPPGLPRTGLPVELVQRRPDLMSAFFRVQAADADLASAISEKFPRLDLTGVISSSNERASSLFDDWLASVAGSLVSPVLDGGEREAEVRRSRAVREELLADYGQAVLVALREVEDGLVLESQQRKRIVELERQLELSDRSYKQLLVEYLNGVSSYIDVLTALTVQQRLERDLLSARRQLIGFRIGLYRALAGGF